MKRMTWIAAVACGTLILPNVAVGQPAPALAGRLKVTSEKAKPHVLKEGDLLMVGFKGPKNTRRFVVRMRMACQVACKGVMFLSQNNFGPQSSKSDVLLAKRFDNTTAKEPITFERPEGFDGGKFGNYFITVIAESGMVTLVRSDSPLQKDGKEMSRQVDLTLRSKRNIVPTMSEFNNSSALGIHYEVEAYR